jgi:hypothetical protein
MRLRINWIALMVLLIRQQKMEMIFSVREISL